jgi:hypothetical protein
MEQIMNHQQFDREKMRAVILRAIRRCSPAEMGAVKLNKVLYFVDMTHYAHFHSPVTGSTYKKRPNGPTTDQLLFTLRDMERDGQLKIDNVDYHGYWKKEYTALVDEPENVLNRDEQELVDDIVEFVCKQHTAKTISEYSHKLPWELAEDGGIISYSSAMLLFPMQTSPEAFDMASNGAEEVEVARQNGKTMGGSSVSAFRSRVLAKIGQH